MTSREMLLGLSFLHLHSIPLTLSESSSFALYRRNTVTSKIFVVSSAAFYRTTPVPRPLSSKYWGGTNLFVSAPMIKKTVAVALLKVTLISSQVLVLQQNNDQCNLDTDARDKKLGCVFLHEKEFESNSVDSYWSRTLCDKKRKSDILN